MKYLMVIGVVAMMVMFGAGCDTALSAIEDGIEDSDLFDDLRDDDDDEREVRATLSGTVAEIHEYDELMLDDGTGLVEVFVRGGHGPDWYAVGETISVRGWLEWAGGGRELYAHEIVLADGRVVSIAGGDDWD